MGRHRLAVGCNHALVLDDDTFGRLVVGLADKDPAVVADAQARLVAAGADTAPRVIDALRRLSLRNRNSPREDPFVAALVDVLLAQGDAALAPLVAAIPAAVAADRTNGTITRREIPWPVGHEAYILHVVLRNLEVSDTTRYLPLLRHPERDVRYRALGGLATPSSAAHTCVEQILPLLSDPDAHVANQALNTLAAMGTDARDALRRLARAPGPHRERALAALAAHGEWPLLEPSDRALLERWIESRVAAEPPERIAEGNGDILCDWFAVPTADHDALVEVLGLYEPMPVTMRLGWRLVNRDVVYLTPELNGWTLIFYYFEYDALQDFVVELSRHFGAAQYFGSDYGYKGWALAEDGELQRLYLGGDETQPDTSIGPPHPAEVLVSEGLWRDEDEPEGRPLCGPQHVAGYASVDPTRIGPDTTARGHGLVAGTTAGWHRTLGW